MLQQIPDVLKIPVEAFKNFYEEQAITIISSTFNDGAAVVQHNPVFNPIEAVLKLHDGKNSPLRAYAQRKKRNDSKAGKTDEINNKTASFETVFDYDFINCLLNFFT